MFEIDKAILTDGTKKKQQGIGNLIAEISILESIYSAYVAVDVMIYDTFALTDEFPIRGEETLEIHYTDYFSKTSVLNLHVYAIDAVAPDDKSDSQSYILHCLSADFMTNETTRIQQSFNGTISDMVTTVSGMYLVSKQIDIEPTDGNRRFVIPSFTPVETLQFFSRKAQSQSNKSSNYLFFENREKVYFKTHEQILKDNENLPERNTFYYGQTKLDVTERNKLMNHAQTLKPKNRFNTVNTVRRGAMVTEVFRIDPATRSFTNTVYDHGDEFGSYQHMDRKSKEYHSSDFRSKYLSKENNVVNTFLTFEESNEDQHNYSEIIPRRNSTSFYLGSNVMEIEIYGCNDIFAGSVINLVIPEMKYTNSEKNIHPNLSGRYLVESISHLMAEKQWKMTLQLIKDSFVDG
jgi:hypothetical protein